MNAYFFTDPFLHREYNLFGQNTESSLDQWKWKFALSKKVNNSIATKLPVTLINSGRIFLKDLNGLHNWITKLCSALFKCGNRLKLGWENECTVLKCTQMRARVEKVDVLGWTQPFENKAIQYFCGLIHTITDITSQTIRFCSSRYFLGMKPTSYEMYWIRHGHICSSVTGDNFLRG